jgi:hypothetical protein
VNHVKEVVVRVAIGTPKAKRDAAIGRHGHLEQQLFQVPPEVDYNVSGQNARMPPGRFAQDCG